MAHIDSINCRREYVHWGCADQVVDLCDESGPMAASAPKNKNPAGISPDRAQFQTCNYANSSAPLIRQQRCRALPIQSPEIIRPATKKRVAS
jgi:hypothetical protein